MANEAESYSPIIQAMIATSNRQQQREQLAEQIRAAKSDEAHKQQLLSQAQSFHDTSLDLENRRLDLEKEREKNDAAVRKLQGMQVFHSLIQGGLRPSLINAGPEGATDTNTPTAEDLNKVEANRAQLMAGAQTTGQLAAAQPFQIAQEQRQFDYTRAGKEADLANEKDLEGFKNKNDMAKTAFVESSKQKIAQMERGTQMALGNLSANVQMQRTAAEYGISPEESQARTLGIFTGQIKPTNNPIDRRIVDSGVAQGFKVPAKEGDELKALDSLGPILQEMKDFTDKYSASSGIGAKVKSATAGVVNPEAKAAEANLMSHIQAVEGGLEGFTGSLQRLAKGFQAGSGLIPSLDQSKDANKLHIEEVEKTIRDRQQEILKALPPVQRDMFQKVYGISLGKDAPAPSASGVTHKYNPLSGQIEAVK